MKHVLLGHTNLSHRVKTRKKLYPNNQIGFFSDEFLSRRRPNAIGKVRWDTMASIQGCVIVRHGKTSKSDTVYKLEEIRFCKLPRFHNT